jgi:ribosomal protein L12E/L44/L45/RPP1/RPP2
MMKTKLATALSIVGVLGAGSAAALVNTQILDGSGSESTASAAVLPPAATIDLTVPSTTIDDSDAGVDDETDRGSTSTTTTSVPEATTTTMIVTTTTAPAPTGEFLTAFNVGDSGVVTVDVVNGRLILVKAEASPNWTVTRAEEVGADHLEVTFVSSTVRVEFAADFDGAAITPSVASAAIPAPASAAAPAAPAPSVGNDDDGEYEDDDEYDDEYDDDEYEDEDHEDRGGDDHGDDGRDDDGDDGRDDD